MAGEEIYLNYFLYGLLICVLAYVISLGRNGLLIFKINFPGKKRAGTWYIKLLRTGRIGISYGRFKTMHKWKDKSETQITHVFDRTDHTREPIIGLIEGYAFNVPLSALLESFPKDAKEVTTFMKTIYAMGLERVDLEDSKKTDWLFWLQIALPIFLILIGLGIIYLVTQVGDGNMILKQIAESVAALKPTIIGGSS